MILCITVRSCETH